MKKILVCILTVSLFISLFIFSVSANSSVSLSGFDNIISWSIVDDPDDGVESVSVQFRAYGSSSWIQVDEILSEDMRSITSYIIPDNLYTQGNSFRIALNTPNGVRYSSLYTVSDPFFSNFTLRYDVDEQAFFVSSASPSSIILHFQYLGTASDYPASFPDITIPAYTDSVSYSYFYAVSDNGKPKIVYPPHDCLVYATTSISGVTYSSNTVRLYGFVHSSDISLPVDTSISIPTDSQISTYTSLIYSPVLETPVFRYTASAAACIFPLVFMAFIYRKIIL